MTAFRRCVALFTATCIAGSALAQGAPATLIGTEQLAVATSPAAAVPGVAQQRLLATLDRADLAEALRSRGVAPLELKARVAALTDAEATEMLARIDAAPAGGDILGLLFTTFVILLVTDILGFTKVFPFTRPVR